MDDFRERIVVKKPNENPYVNHLLTLYSQSKSSNKGTRGLDDFGKMTYVDTKLDEELKPLILQGRLRLAIITGNAGDGKTAFIQRLEEEVRSRCSSFEARSNGARFILNGLEVQTNYDGSQDEGALQSDEVLKAFFSEFRGNYIPTFNTKLTKVIAINQGRLLDFLQTYRQEFDWLFKLIQDYFVFEIYPVNRDVCIINLNARAIVNDLDNSRFNDSILDKLLDAFIDEVMWTPCESCDIKQRCYIKYNIDTLRDSEKGKYIRSSLKRLFLTTHMRGHLHITVRDLRSAISFILFNISNCQEIHELQTNEEEILSRFYYNAAFGSQFNDDPQLNDRLLALLSEIDVSRVSNPKLDGVINFMPELVLPLKKAYDIEKLTKLRNMKSYDPFQQDKERDAQNICHRSIRRKIFFETNSSYETTSATDMLPYKKLDEFVSIMLGRKDLDSIRRDIIFAISTSEGIYNQELAKKYVCIKINKRAKSEVKSFYVHEAYDFTCIKDHKSFHPFVEFVPNAIIFMEKKSKFALRINLDLFEMLYKIASGYSPTPNEMKGSFLDLLMFKKQLGSISSNRLIITDNDRDFYEVKRVDDRLVMDKMV